MRTKFPWSLYVFCTILSSFYLYIDFFFLVYLHYYCNVLIMPDILIQIVFWWLHASENPSSILCVVSGHLCAFLSIKTYFQALFILLCQIKHYHTIPYYSLFKSIYLFLYIIITMSRCA